MIGILIRRGNLDKRHAYRKDDVKRQGEASCLQAEESGLAQILPHNPQKEPTMPTP